MAGDAGAMTALIDDARFWRTLPGEGDGTYVAREGLLLYPVARCFVRLQCLECPKEEDMEPMRARSVRRRGAEAVDVVMLPHERAKASATASKLFLLMLLGMMADGGCTHLAFTDGSKVGAEASKDGAAHVACGVFEGASMACGEVRDGHNYNFVSAGEPNAFRAYGCALPAEAEVPDAEMAGIILFLERCVRAAEAPGAAPVHAIVAVDSEACLVDIEAAWRGEDARALAPRNRAALLETICALRKRLVERGGSSRFVWCPAHVGIYGNLAADAVAKAFLYEPAMEPALHVRRSVHIQTLRSRAASYALPADRRPFRLTAQAALGRGGAGAAAGGPEQEAGVGNGRRRRGCRDRRGGGGGGRRAVAGHVAYTGSRGAGSRQGRRRRAQVAGGGRGDEPRRERRRRDATPAVGDGRALHACNFMLRSGGTLEGLFGLACCPLCGREGVPLARLAARAQRRVLWGRGGGGAGARGDAAERPGRGAAAAG